MALSGWIKLHRALADHHIASEPASLAVWVHLLLHANHAETKRQINGRLLTLSAGQLITSRKSISEKTGVQESKVERILKMLKSEQQIEQHGSSKFRVISIVNWHEYQGNEQQSEHLVNSTRTTGEQQVNTLEEVLPVGNTEECKEGKENNIGAPDKPARNKSAGKGSQKVNESLGAMMEILPGLSEQTASEYLAFRKAKKAPLTPGAWKKIASEIVKSGLPPDDALNTAMARGWQGFDASWLSGASGSGGRGLSKQEAIEAANQRVVDQMVAEEQARKLGYSAQPDIDLGGAIVIDGEVIHAD